MKHIKKLRLERAGWAVGDSAQFLQLSAKEKRFIELKLALATRVRELRERRGLTQAALAHRLGSSQSRVAKMEAADHSVSLDLIMRSLLAIGATATDIAKWIENAKTASCLETRRPVVDSNHIFKHSRNEVIWFQRDDLWLPSHPTSPRILERRRRRSLPHGQATAWSPFLATRDSNLSEDPCGRFSPRSHWLTSPVVTLR